MVYKREEGQAETPSINAFYKIIGKEEINQWAKWNLIKDAAAFILIMFLIWFSISGIFENSLFSPEVFDNTSFLTLSVIALAALLYVEVKEYRKTKFLLFARIVIDGQTEFGLRSFLMEYLSVLKCEADEAFHRIVLLKYSKSPITTVGFILETMVRVQIIISVSIIIFAAYYLQLPNTFDASILLDWVHNSSPSIIAILTALFLVISFYEAKLSKPIYKKMLSFKAPTLNEFNESNGNQPFIVFDRAHDEYWKQDGFARTKQEAQIFHSGFETQHQLDLVWKHRCRLEFLSTDETAKLEVTS